MNKQLIIIFFLIFLYNSVSCQEKKIWSLNDCINYALNENLYIKQSENNFKIAENNYNQSFLNLLPDLNAQTSRNYYYGDKFNVYTSNYEQGFTTGDNYSVSSSVTIFNGLFNINTIKKNKLILQTKELEFQKNKDDLTIEIIYAYFNILFNTELVEMTIIQKETTERLYEKTKILVVSDKITKNNLLDIEAQISKEEYNLMNATNNMNLAYFNLYQLLNINFKDSFKITEPDTNSFYQLNYNLDEILDYVINNNSEIAISEYQFQIAKTNLKIAKSYIFPNVNVFGYLTTSYSSAYSYIDYSTSPEYTGISSTLYITESGENIYQKNYVYNSYIMNYDKQLKENLYNYFGV